LQLVVTGQPSQSSTSLPLHLFVSCWYSVQVDEAGIDVLLVGDSVAMVVHGHDTTLPITLEEMLMHCRYVAGDGLMAARLIKSTTTSNPVGGPALEAMQGPRALVHS
jgi:hypothetical protein